MSARGVELHPERNARIVSQRLDGARLDAIAELNSMTRRAVSAVLIRAGLTAPLADPAIKETALALAAEHGCAEAAHRVRFSPFTVRRWVRQAKEAARVS